MTGRLSGRDAAALLDLVHDGDVDATNEPFPTSVLAALSRLIPSDACVGYQEADVADRFFVVEQLEVIGQPTSRDEEAAFHTLGWQNPMHCRLHAHSDRVLRLSDLLTRRQRRSLAWNAAVWRPHGIDDALRMWLPARPGRAISIYVERSGKNYTVRELALFSLLRPHLIRMHANATSRRRFAHRLENVTPREAEVLGWIARGKTNSEIARLLVISPHTVRKHVENIFEKLDVRTRTAAARYAKELDPGG
jgi:DNA-binding CsgD family transcriptional regulator